MAASDIPVIDDNNFERFMDVHRNAGARGYWGMFEDDGMRATVKRFEDTGLEIIPENQWDDIIRQRQKDRATTRMMMDDAGLGPLNQKNLPYCWAFAPTQGCQVVRLRETGQIHKYSPSSAANPIKGWRAQGGWGSQFYEYVKVNGLNYTADYPDVTLSRQYYTPENREKAKKNLILEAFLIEGTEPQAWLKYGTCMLNGLTGAAGLPYWSHEVLDCEIVLVSHEIDFINSWDMWGDKGWGRRAGSKRFPRNGDYVVIRSMLAA